MRKFENVSHEGCDSVCGFLRGLHGWQGLIFRSGFSGEIANKLGQQAQVKRFNKNSRESFSPPRFLFLLSSSWDDSTSFLSLSTVLRFFDPCLLIPSECVCFRSGVSCDSVKERCGFLEGYKN